MQNICWIHGFNSSHRSFNFVQAKLPSHEIVVVNYDSHQPLEKSLTEVKRQLPKGNMILVGHSLGGVIATLLAEELQARTSKLVTISSPLGGSKAASTLRWIPGYPKMLNDITPNSAFMTRISAMKLPVPTISIISTGGSLPTTQEPNDSVVTVSSQKALKFGKKFEVKANHFEVLMHDKTIKHIQDFLFEEDQV